MTSKIKILHIFSSWTIGGAEKATLFLADSLQKYLQETENIVAVPDDSYMFSEATKAGLRTYNFKARGSLDISAISTLNDIVKKENINIIHAHQGKLYWTALIVKFFNPKIKVVFHRRQDTRHSFYSRFHYKFADAVICVSESVANGLIKYEKVSPQKISVVYNGVNFSKFSDNVDFSEIIAKYKLEGKKTIGTVGAINDLKGKGQIYLVEAAARLREKYEFLRYLIVGQGNGLADLKKYAKDLHVEDIIIFAGYQEAVQKYVAASDIICLLSWHTEGMPNVLIEAQALGKPVIATNIGGNPEAFKNGVSGLLIKPNDTNAVVEAISILLDSPQTTKAMGLEGKSFVRKRFTIEAMVNNTLKIYKKILGL